MKNLHGKTPLKSRIQAKLRKVCFYVLQNVNKFFYCHLKTSFRPSKTLGFPLIYQAQFSPFCITIFTSAIFILLYIFYTYIYEYFIRIYQYFSCLHSLYSSPHLPPINFFLLQLSEEKYY